MTDVIDTLDQFFVNMFDLTLPSMYMTDVVEIIIIAFFFYEVLVWIKNTRAWMLFKGILIILGFFMMAAVFQMNTILWLGEKLLNAGIIALIVVFQPELRHALEELGRKNLLQALTQGFTRPAGKRFSDHTLNDLVRACFDMGAVKTGALIVVEQDTLLTEYERTGIPVDALLSRQLLINIFEKNTPLHDGAILVRGDRVVSATCYLPLTESSTLSKDLGTRHRAAVGVSEVSDALTIVVSEETGKVSVTRDGRLTHDITPKDLTEALEHLQNPDSDKMPRKKGRHLFSRKGVKHER